MAEVSRHDVWLYNDLIGHLNTHDNFTWFEFTPEYVRDPLRPVLGLKFEENLHARVASNLRLPSWFSNLLPEGTLRDWIAAERNVSPSREMQLLSQVGGDLPGAVAVLPSRDPNDEPLPVLDIESLILPAEAKIDQRWRFSLAGVGLKFSMLRKEDRFTCTATGRGGDWILKIPDALYRDVPINEFSMMRFAGAIGIDVPEVRLVHRDLIENLPVSVWPNHEEWAFAVRRFDRSTDRTRVHIEDLAQVRNFYPVQKYDGNFETVAALLFRGHDEYALGEFVRRLTFNVLIGNGDAHLKNWSLIYRDKRVPTISPAYDIVSTQVYRPVGEPEDLGLKFGGSKRSDQVRARQFDRLAQRLGSSELLSAICADTVRRAVDAWPRIEDELGGQTAIREPIRRSLIERERSLLGIS